VSRPAYQSPVKAVSGGLRPCRPAEGFYHWKDITVGKPLAVYGFNLLVTHADTLTSTFYNKRSGVSSPDIPDVPFVRYAAAKLERQQDSVILVSFTSLHLCSSDAPSLTRSASTQPTAFLNYTERCTPAMRFTASMVNAPNFECTKSDTQRRFVLSFYVDDGTLCIAEPPNKLTHTGTPVVHTHLGYFHQQFIAKV
jgi:hypothetical protein